MAANLMKKVWMKNDLGLINDKQRGILLVSKKDGTNKFRTHLGLWRFLNEKVCKEWLFIPPGHIRI